MKDPIKYLGIITDQTGRHISKKKTRATLEMPVPMDVSLLRSFFGLVQHHAKFLPSLSKHCAVFYALLKKEATGTGLTHVRYSLTLPKRIGNLSGHPRRLGGPQSTTHNTSVAPGHHIHGSVLGLYPRDTTPVLLLLCYIRGPKP